MRRVAAATVAGGALALPAAAADVHWSYLPAPPSPPVTIAAHGDDLLALTQDGAVVALRGETWEVVAPAAPERPDNLHADDQGVSTWATGRPYVRRFAGGEWQPIERTRVPIVDLATAADGATWAIDARGGATVRTERGWGSSDIGTLGEFGERSLRIIDDPTAGVWVSGHSTSLLYLTTDSVRNLDLPIPGRLLAVDALGHPILAMGGLAHGVDGVPRPITFDPLTFGTTSKEGSWVGSRRATWLVREDELLEVPFPGDLVALVASREGRAFALDRQGAVYASAPGPGPALVESAAAHGLVDVTDSAIVAVGDMDADGDDDLVTVDDDGQLVLIHQGPGGFETQHTPVRADVHGEITAIAACDLDGNGRADLLFRESYPDGTVRLRYLRALDGWFNDVSTAGLDASSESLADRAGPIRCLDADQDGDLDVLLPAGPGPSRGVRLLDNTGYGRLVQVPLAARGLGAAYADVHDVRTGDLDGDGRNDLLLVVSNGPHRVLRRLPDGGLRDATEEAGLAVRSTSATGWITDVDRDGGLDIVVLDGWIGPRLWRNQGGLHFAERTYTPGPSPDRWGFDPQPVGALVDLDLDGVSDIVSCTRARCSLAMAGAGLQDASDALPSLSGGLAVLALDVGTDGDQDLLLIGRGDDRLFESHASAAPRLSAAPSAAEASVDRVTRLLRSLAWVRPSPDGWLVLLMLAPLGLAHALTRLRGARLVLGRGAGVLAISILVLAAYVLLVEAPVGRRVALSAGVGALALVGTWVEIRWEMRRRARRVGSYRLGEKLGLGGMGTVYLATHEPSGRKVAVKIVHPELLASDEDRAMFSREATIGSQIDDPRIVQIQEWGECVVFNGDLQQRTAYLVMELLEGQTLRRYLDRYEVLPVAQAAALAREVALALATVHDAGIVHRDVKPDNVMLIGRGRVKLMDLGAARHAGHRTVSRRQVLGTLGYFAPEQGRGRAPDPRSDIYAACVILYEMLAGARPFEGDDLVDLLQQVASAPPPPILRDDVPEGLWLVVLRGLQKEPLGRFPNARALADALEPYAGELIVAAPELPVGPASSIEPFIPADEGDRGVGPLTLVGLYLRTAWRLRRVPTALDIVGAIALHAWRVVPDDTARTRLAERLRRLSTRFERRRGLTSGAMAWRTRQSTWVDEDGTNTHTSAGTGDITRQERP